MDTNSGLMYLACLIFLFIVGRIFLIPLKKLMKLLFNSLLGAGLIYIINLIGATWGFRIGINIVTAIVVRNIRSSRCDTCSSIKTANLTFLDKNSILYTYSFRNGHKEVC